MLPTAILPLLTLLAAAGVSGPVQATDGVTASGLSSPQEVGAEPVPANTRVNLESAWLVTEEASGRVRLVADARPEGASERLYTGRFRYEGDQRAYGLQVVIAIPAGVRYIAGSATGPGANVSFSVDGGETFAPAGALTVPADPADPASGMRPATADDYSHVRWRLAGEYLPGTAGLVSFRAKPVETVAPEEAS